MSSSNFYARSLRIKHNLLSHDLSLPPERFFLQSIPYLHKASLDNQYPVFDDHQCYEKHLRILDISFHKFFDISFHFQPGLCNLRRLYTPKIILSNRSVRNLVNSCMALHIQLLRAYPIYRFARHSTCSRCSQCATGLLRSIDPPEMEV